LKALQNVLTANRVAAIMTWLTGLAAFILGVAHTLPGRWPNYALAASGLLTKLVTTYKFLEGSQKFDALTTRTYGSPVDPNSILDEIDGIGKDRPESATKPDNV
jgi:hypothetical protein